MKQVLEVDKEQEEKERKEECRLDKCLFSHAILAGSIWRRKDNERKKLITISITSIMVILFRLDFSLFYSVSSSCISFLGPCILMLAIYIKARIIMMVAVELKQNDILVLNQVFVDLPAANCVITFNIVAGFNLIAVSDPPLFH